MPLSGHVVQNHARKMQTGFEMFHAGYDGRSRAGHFCTVHGQHYGRLQNPRHMRRGAGTFEIAAVEETAIALDDGDVGLSPGTDAAELERELFIVQKVGIETGGRFSGGQSKPGIVDVVRSLLAWLHGKTASGEEA